MSAFDSSRARILCFDGREEDVANSIVDAQTLRSRAHSLEWRG